jgi:L-aspartate oxidase
MPDYDPRAELAPRDVVTRGIMAAMQAESSRHVLLDLRHLGEAFLAQRFPTIVARLREDGLDPAREPIPVGPAAHYLMGGIRTDLNALTSIPGLYAAGECACTGVHGANRLASNSLLECLVFGRRAGLAAQHPTPSPAPLQLPVDMPGGLPNPHPADDLATLQHAMRTQVGPLRSGHSVEAALAILAALPVTATPDADAITLANAVLTARLIATGALLRRESRGGHFRSDYPAPNDAWLAHITQARGHTPELVATVAEPASAAA